jgi:hypothetical protein
LQHKRYNVVSQTRIIQSITYTIDKVVGKNYSNEEMVPLMLQEETNLYCLSTFSNKLDQKQDLNFDNFNLLNERTKSNIKRNGQWLLVQ